LAAGASAACALGDAPIETSKAKHDASDVIDTRFMDPLPFAVDDSPGTENRAGL
jgi:hypothetical protein